MSSIYLDSPSMVPDTPLTYPLALWHNVTVWHGMPEKVA